MSTPAASSYTPYTLPILPPPSESRERNAAVYHFRQFLLLPYLVDKPAVRAHGQDFDPHSFELLITGSNRCQFCWSDKGEVSGVETEDDPFSLVV